MLVAAAGLAVALFIAVLVARDFGQEIRNRRR